MFGEVMGKTKDQLRRELWKMRLKRLRRHIPAIIGAVGTIAATAAAVHYKNEAERLSAVDESADDWASIHVPPHMVESLEDGHTLHHRRVRVDGDDWYMQWSTSLKGVGFSPEMDENFKNASEEGAA
ncbi:hypothetical protein SEA_MADAMATO_46 [Streptomyces phage Madamato]|nr:hypothetical protein SEA_MADAMATO_46 [Streptomyces phage Madamato]